MRFKVLLALIFFNITSVCVAQNYSVSDESRSIPVYVQEFSGGLISHANNKVVKENAGSVVKNARFNKKNGSVQKRNVMKEYGSVGSNKITGLHRYYKSNDDKYLIAASGQKLYIGDDEEGTFQEAYSGLSDGARFTFETYKDVAICANGSDPILKFDGNINIGTDEGDRSDGFLMAELGAPFADVTASGSLDASKWYQYKVLFKDSDGLYYYSDARSNPLKVGASNKSVQLTQVPIGRTGTILRQIYRTEGNDSAVDVQGDTTYKLVGTISDNSTLAYTDTLADASLGVVLSTAGHIDVTPPKGKFLEIHSERLFVSGNGTNKSDIYWSDEFNPDFFLATSFEQIRPDDGDEITFIKAVWGILAVGKRNSIQKFYTSGAESSWYISGVYSVLGASAPYTVRNTALGLIYLGRHGLYRFDGQASYLISDAVTDKIRDINQADIEECFGMYWNNEYHLAYTSEDSGQSYNNRVLVYDLVRQNYTLDYKNINCMTTLESGLDYGLLYFGSSLTDGKVTSDGSTVTLILKKYKSELDEGTYSDTRSFGSEVQPSIELAWDSPISDITSANGYLTIGDMNSVDPLSWLIPRPDDNGTWTSPSYRVNADSFEKVYWNESLGDFGDITCRIRTATSSDTLSISGWSENFSSPSGSDISSLSGNDYLQVSFDLTTTDLVYTPQLYKEDQFVFKVVYNKTGTDSESFNMLWESGWRYLGLPSYRVQIKRIKVFYETDENDGEFTVSYLNDSGDSNGSFTIDLSRESSTEEYGGADFYRIEDDIKVYTHYPGDAFGDLWKFQITDDEAGSYRVDRIEVLIWHEEYPDL